MRTGQVASKPRTGDAKKLQTCFGAAWRNPWVHDVPKCLRDIPHCVLTHIPSFVQIGSTNEQQEL